MVGSAVVLLADLSARQILVAHVPHCFSHWRLAIAVSLVLAGFSVEVSADVGQGLLLPVLVSVLLLPLELLGLLSGDPPLTLPVSPYMGQLVCRQEGLPVLPVESISAENVVHELCENCGPLAVSHQIFLQVIGVNH